MSINIINGKTYPISNRDFNIKEIDDIKNRIDCISNTFSSFYVERKNNTFLLKLSFFIKKIFNLKTDLTFLLDKSQHAKLNNLSTILGGGEKIKFKNNKLINSDYLSFKTESLDSFFLTLKIAMKNDFHDCAKKVIQKFLYEKAKTKKDFVTILSISLDVINNFQKERFEQLSRHSTECANILDYINLNYKQHINMALDYACKEMSEKESHKMGNSIMYLVNIMHDIYSMEMEKRFIINITKCFIDKVEKYNVERYNNDRFNNSILNLLGNKIKNNEGVKEFVDNMLSSGLLEHNDIIKAKENTADDEFFISEYNRKIKLYFNEYIKNKEIKDNIANVIRDNYTDILNKMKNKSNSLENERVLLDIIDCLKSDIDFSLDILNKLSLFNKNLLKRELLT